MSNRVVEAQLTFLRESVYPLLQDFVQREYGGTMSQETFMGLFQAEAAKTKSKAKGRRRKAEACSGRGGKCAGLPAAGSTLCPSCQTGKSAPQPVFGEEMFPANHRMYNEVPSAGTGGTVMSSPIKDRPGIFRDVRDNFLLKVLEDGSVLACAYWDPATKQERDLSAKDKDLALSKGYKLK